MADQQEKCTHCGTPFREGEAFCHHCGRRRDGSEPASAMPFWMREPDEPTEQEEQRPVEASRFSPHPLPPVEEEPPRKETNAGLNRVLIVVIAALLLTTAGIFCFLFIRSSLRGETLTQTLESLFVPATPATAVTPVLPAENTAPPEVTPVPDTTAETTPPPAASEATQPPLTSLCQGTYVITDPDGGLALTLNTTDADPKDGVQLVMEGTEGTSYQSYRLHFEQEHAFTLYSMASSGGNGRLVEINRGYSSTLFAGVPVELWTPHLDTDHLFTAQSEENGLYTLRLAADTGYCLTYDATVGSGAPVTLQPVTSGKSGQLWRLEGTSVEETMVGYLPGGDADPEAFILYAGYNLLTREALYPYTREQVEYIRSGLYALAGRSFSNSRMQAYFEGKAWYTPVNDDAAVVAALTEIQKQNITLLIRYEEDLGWR